MTEIFGNVVAKSAQGTWTSFTAVERALLAAGSVACIAVFLSLGHLCGLPDQPHFSASILAGNEVIITIIFLLVATALSFVIGTPFTGFLQAEGGLFCCCIGLAAWSIRCGAIKPLLQYASGPSIFLCLIVEVLLLSAMVLGSWWGMTRVFEIARQKHSVAKIESPPNEIVGANVQQIVMATATQACVMAFCEMVIIQTDNKAQVLAGMVIAAFLGTFAAYQMMALSHGFWYWIGPVFVAVVGYLMAYFNPEGMAIGDIHGWAAGLARPIPMDYASLGIAGSVFGYWTARRVAQPDALDLEDADIVNAPAQSVV